MGRKLTNGLALGLVAGAVFALANGPVERHKPAVPAAPSVLAVDGTLVVDLQDGSSEADLQEVEGRIGADLDWLSPLSIDEGIAVGHVDDLDGALRALADDPRVEAAEPEMFLEATSFPNDPMYDKQWHLRAMGAPEGWAETARGRGVIVAVVDTGIAKVEDLQGTKILPGASFVPGTTDATDDQGHGTHVAGTIAQTTNNGIGVAGVAPEATLMPVKVLSSMGFGSSAWIASGIDYAVDEGADVINLSLGGGYSAIIHNAIKKAKQHGVIVVAAAGNSGRRGVGYPGALEEAIGVSATGPDGSMAPYSSYGEGVDIAAPGGDKRKAGGGVLQDTIDGKGGHHYVEYQGTSMATPHVAGAAAILLSQGMAPETVERVLLQTAKGDGQWNEKFGHGQLDLGAALSKAGPQFGATRFALGAIFALLIAQLAATGRAFQIKSSVAGGVVAGGLFALAWIPGLPDVAFVRMLMAPVLEWPAVLFGHAWSQFPLWLSALVPVAIGFTLGAFERTRWIAFGLACGIGAHLLHGAATHTLIPSWLPAALGTTWLVGNATVCVVLGLGLAGAQKLEEAEAR
ncbi:MAG: S8 family serine peptidase [Myxococcota bacterium]